jgi:hypothetical protein
LWLGDEHCGRPGDEYHARAEILRHARVTSVPKELVCLVGAVAH